VIDLYETLTMLDARGVGFRVLTGNIDTTTPQGRLFFTLLAAFAEFERELIVERSLAGKAARAKLGKHPGGARMYGLDIDHETEVPEEAARLREAANYVVRGGRVAQLVAKWNQDGVPTASGAGQWRDATLRDMLLNPRVAAIIGANKHAQLVLQLSRPMPERQGRPPASLLHGMLICGNCGARMYAGHVAGNKAAYGCKTPHASTGYKGCGKVTITRKGLEELIVGAFMDVVSGPDFEYRRQVRLKTMLGGEVNPKELDAWRADLEELEPIVGSRFATQAQRDLYAELDRKVKEATQRLLVQPDADTLASLPTAADKLRQEWERWSLAERRAALRVVIESITILPAKLGKRQGSRLDVDRVKPTWLL
jgi:hypothetical protein